MSCNTKAVGKTFLCAAWKVHLRSILAPSARELQALLSIWHPSHFEHFRGCFAQKCRICMRTRFDEDKSHLQPNQQADESCIKMKTLVHQGALLPSPQPHPAHPFPRLKKREAMYTLRLEMGTLNAAVKTLMQQLKRLLQTTLAATRLPPRYHTQAPPATMSSKCQ